MSEPIKRKRKSAAPAEPMPEGGTLAYSWSDMMQPEGNANVSVHSTASGTLEHLESLLRRVPSSDYPTAKEAPGYIHPQCVKTDNGPDKKARPGMFYRCGESVAAQSVFMFDVDECTTDQYYDLLDLLAAADCWSATYTTAKHTEEAPRFRVLFATAQPATTHEEIMIARASLVHKYLSDVKLDAVWKKVSQLMWLPPRGSVLEINPGKLLPLAGLRRYAAKYEVEVPKAAAMAAQNMSYDDDAIAIFAPFLDQLLSMGGRTKGTSVLLPATAGHAASYTSPNNFDAFRFTPPDAHHKQFNVQATHATDVEAMAALKKHSDKLRYACEAVGADADLLLMLQGDYHRYIDGAGQDTGYEVQGEIEAQAQAEAAGAAPINSGLTPITLRKLKEYPEVTEEEVEATAQWMFGKREPWADVRARKIETAKGTKKGQAALKENAKAEEPKEEGEALGIPIEDPRTVDEYQKKARSVLIRKYFAKRFVFVASGSRVLDLALDPSTDKSETRIATTGYELRDFFNLHRNMYFEVMDENGKIKQRSYADDWMESEDRQTAQSFAYVPGGDRLLRGRGKNAPMYVNVFYVPPFRMTDEHDLLDEFLKIVKRTHVHANEAEMFLDWLAFTFRYPAEKVQWAYTNVSETRGSGRGLLGNAINNLLGGHNVTTSNVKQIASDTFHDYAFRSLVTLVEEADSDNDGKRIKVDGRWNDIITAKSGLLNIKCKGQVNTNLYNNMVFFLNRYSLILSEEDRRIQATTGAPEGTEKLDALWVNKWAGVFRNGEEFRDQLASFLWRRDLSNFEYGHADRSLPARAKMLENSATPADEMADELLAELPGVLCTSRILRSLVEQKCATQKIVQPNILLMVIKNRARETGVQVFVDKKNYSCLLFGDMPYNRADDMRNVLAYAKRHGVNA